MEPKGFFIFSKSLLTGMSKKFCIYANVSDGV